MWRISVTLIFLFPSLFLIGITGLLARVYCRGKGRQRRIQKDIEHNRMHKVDVTLDPNSAHPYLNLSRGGKEVKYGKKRVDYCDGPNNFDDFVFVLGKEGFQKSFYFEVQVRGKTHWTIGVAKGSIRKKGEIILKPENGFWTLKKKNNKFSPHGTVSLRHKIKKVGVFVNYNIGVVSFYDVDAMSHIYSFADQCFSEKLYPILSPDFKHDGKNGAPLVITDVPKSYLRRNITDTEEQSTTNANNDALLSTVNLQSE